MASLKRTALKRKPGYLEECLRLGNLDESTGLVHFTPESWIKIRLKYRLGAAQGIDAFNGFTEQKGFGLGDAIASVATPIARALKMDCIDKGTGGLKPESGCAKRRDALNKKVPSLTHPKL